MILINLLPHRAEKRKRRKQAFFTLMGVAALGGVAVCLAWYGYLQQMISAQQARNDFLVAKNAELDKEIADVQTLQAEITALQARQKAVQDLQTNRNTPVRLLNELVRQTPEGIYLTSVRQEGESVTVAGMAQSNEQISELLRNTANNSEWLERPELQESKAVTANVGPRSEAKRLFEFAIKLALKRSQDPQAAASEASAASAASAPQL